MTKRRQNHCTPNFSVCTAKPAVNGELLFLEEAKGLKQMNLQDHNGGMSENDFWW